MAVYVLVGGGWLGGWCWQGVARRLRQEGHDAYPVTLTGLGKRVHLASPGVDFETHITDVVNLIEATRRGVPEHRSLIDLPRIRLLGRWVNGPRRLETSP